MQEGTATSRGTIEEVPQQLPPGLNELKAALVFGTLRAVPPVGTSNAPARATGRGNCSVRARNLLQNFHQ
jgi:hypothetical protein